MKVYVSEKDIEENDLNFIEDEFVEKYWLLRGDKFEDDGGFEVHDDVGMVEIETLEQHDLEIRADERKKVCEELLEWADSKMMDWINSPKYREPRFRGTRIIHYYDLQQKLTELKGE
jgi:hypothetical protein